MNIIDHSDEEILAVAHPMWDDLIKYSNKGQYGKFIRQFSYDLLLGLNEVDRRGQHVTVLYRVRSTEKEGEWLGRLVLGYEKGEIRIFSASIF
jgi:hypothetical protein